MTHRRSARNASPASARIIFKANDAPTLQAWRITAQDSDQIAPSAAAFMVNDRVDDLHALVQALKAEGCHVLVKIDETDYRKFAWVIDPRERRSSCGDRLQASEQAPQSALPIASACVQWPIK